MILTFGSEIGSQIGSEERQSDRAKIFISTNQRLAFLTFCRHFQFYLESPTKQGQRTMEIIKYMNKKIKQIEEEIRKNEIDIENETVIERKTKLIMHQRSLIATKQLLIEADQNLLTQKQQTETFWSLAIGLSLHVLILAFISCVNAL